MYKTIYDIEIDKFAWFSNIFKTEKYELVFVFLFNQTDIPNAYFGLIEPDPVIWQIFGLWYWMVKADKATAREYFNKAIEAGNYNAYISLSNIAETKEEKLAHLLFAYSNNVEFSAGNLAVYYMGEKSEKSDELAIKYFTEAIKKGEPNAMNNFGVFYSKQGDKANAVKYFLMGAENGYRVGYWNLLSHYAEEKNMPLFRKYSFYVNIYVPQHAYNFYNKLEPKTEQTNMLLAEYEKFKSQMYVGNSTILTGDYIGKEKMEEFANKVSQGESIKEVIESGNYKLHFEYRTPKLTGESETLDV
jgi:TPR repeat protein